MWNSTNERLRRVIWRCNNKYTVKGEKGCDNRHIDDKVLYQAFVNAFNMMVENKECFIKRWRVALESDNTLQRYRVEEYIRIIDNAEPIREFNESLYLKMVEVMKVVEGDTIIVRLLDGIEIECRI